MKLKPSLFKLLLRMGAKVKTMEGCHKGSNKKKINEKKGSLKKGFLKELSKAISSAAVPIPPVLPAGVSKPLVPFEFRPEAKLGIKNYTDHAINRPTRLVSVGLDEEKMFHVPRFQHEKHLRVAFRKDSGNGRKKTDFKSDLVKMKPDKGLDKGAERLEFSGAKVEVYKGAGERKSILRPEHNLAEGRNKHENLGKAEKISRINVGILKTKRSSGEEEDKRETLGKVEKLGKIDMGILKTKHNSGEGEIKHGKLRRTEKVERIDMSVRKVGEEKGAETRKAEGKNAIEIRLLKEKCGHHQYEIRQDQHDDQIRDLPREGSLNRLPRPLNLADNSNNGDTGLFYNNGEGKESGTEEFLKGESVILEGKLKEQSVVGGETTVRSFLKKLEFNLKEGKREATVELHPPELGKVKFSITLHDGKATARFWLPSPEVKALFENNMHHLHFFFKEQGYSLEASLFYSGGMGNGEGKEEGGLREPGFSKKRGVFGVDNADPISEGEMLYSAETAREGLLNILA